MKKKIIAASMIAALSVTSVAPAVAATKEPISISSRVGNTIPISVNGLEIACDQPPVIIEGRTLVPLRAIFEVLGAEVYWNNDTRSVTATRGDTTILLTIGSSILYRNGETIYMDVPGQIINDRTMVPLRAVSESFGSSVYWDNDTRTVRIYTDTYNEPEEPSEPEKPTIDEPGINEPTDPVAPVPPEDDPEITFPSEPPIDNPNEPSNPEIKPGEGSESEIQTNDWKQGYIDYIIEKENYWGSKFGPESYKGRRYKLIDINGDNIPELYSSFGSTASGDTLCTYYNGQIVEQWMWIMGFRYVEGQNIFISKGGNMGHYYDEIRCIQDGQIKLLDYFTYDFLSYDGFKNKYRYYRNNVEISEEEYKNRLNQYFDKGQLISPFDNTVYDSDQGYIGNGLCSATEIIPVILSY